MDIWHTGGCNGLQPRHCVPQWFQKAKTRQKISLPNVISRVFSLQFSANSHNFRFRSLRGLHYDFKICQIVSYITMINQFDDFFESDSWRIFAF
jgi:hypothetical protein